MRRFAALALQTSLFVLLIAPFALAREGHDGGEGLYGETNDKVVTNAGFLIIAAVPLIIFLLSMLQWRLDKRKYARQAAAKGRAARASWRGGW